MARGAAAGPDGAAREIRPAATRSAAVRVRSARRRKPSSTEWLSRQLNDPYVAEAHRLGYRSRAAFKLIEFDDRFRLLLPGPPGRRSRLRAGRLDAGRRRARRPPRGAVVGIDLAETAPIAGATILRADIHDPPRSQRPSEPSSAVWPISC